MKIAQKFLLTFSGIVFLVAITVLAFAYRSYSGVLEGQIRDKLVAVSAYGMEKIDRLLYRRYEDMEALAADPVICSRTSSAAQVTKKLTEFERRFKGHLRYMSMSFFDLNRRRVADAEGNDFGMRQAFSEFWPAIAAGRDFVLNVSKFGPHNEPAFCFAHIVKDQKGVPFGVVVARTPVEELRLIINRPLGLFKTGFTPDIDLVDKDGLILYSDHDEEGILRDTLSSWDTIRKAQSPGAVKGSLILPASGKKDGDHILIYAGGEGHARLGTNEWTLVITLPKNAAFIPVLKMRNTLIVIILILGFVALSVAYILSRTITKPIILLSNAAAEVGKGNRDISVRIASKDEVGLLGQSFNRMVENLGQTEKEREKLVEDLRDALATIKTLQGILPICSCCKKIRDDEGYWNHLETYISRHTDAVFSHGLCTDCAKKLYPRYYSEEKGE
jgi:HAMP domain-containing protein